MQDQRWTQALSAYRQKIRTAARNADYVSPDHSADDMEQELLVVLWECVQMYNPQRGATFNAFFWMRAKQRIGQLRNRARTQSRSTQLVYLEDEGVAEAVNGVLSCQSAEAAYELQEEVRDACKGHLRGIAAYWSRSVEAAGGRAG